MTTTLPASEYLRDVAAPVMRDSDVADLARRLAREQGGKLSPLDAYRLRMLLDGDSPETDAALAAVEIDDCASRAFGLLERCGLQIDRRSESSVLTTPADFERLFPATGGALYGRASHGWLMPFQRSGSASRMPGLWLAGGSVHPGPGLPMATL